MNNWGWYINDISLHDIISFSYHTRVPIKNPHVVQSVTSKTKEKITGIDFTCQMVTPIII